MTARCVCLLLPAIAGLFAGLFYRVSGLSFLSLTVILWIAGEWIRFQWRVCLDLPALNVVRKINGRADGRGVLFAGRCVMVDVTVESGRGKLQPFTRIRDVVPEIFSLDEKSSELRVVRTSHRVRFQYECETRAAGRASFPGIRLRIQDPFGFFLADRFLPCPQSVRILPDYEIAGDAHPQVKRSNALPQHGIHRLQRAGLGSELLELREYVPGDPPRSIAWKVSARRDQLMTRQYESEVPVRMQLFVEDSARMRAGSWLNRPCDHAGWLAASIAQAALAAGDPVGLVRFSDDDTQRVACGWGERTLFQILESLADNCDVGAPELPPWSRELQDAALEVCRERWPELLDDRVNRVPFTFLPIRPWLKRAQHQRSRLAGVLCQLHQLSSVDWLRLVHDDEFMSRHVQRLMLSAGWSATPPVVPPTAAGDSRMSSGCLDQLARGITHVVARARDNERFLIVADLLNLNDQLDRLRSVVRLARARHHRVSVVCPLPDSDDVCPLSDNADVPDVALETTAGSVPALLNEARDAERRHRRDQTERRLRAMGCSVTFVHRSRPMRLVLSELRLTRGGRAMAGV